CASGRNVDSGSAVSPCTYGMQSINAATPNDYVGARLPNYMSETVSQNYLLNDLELEGDFSAAPPNAEASGGLARRERAQGSRGAVAHPNGLTVRCVFQISRGKVSKFHDYCID